MQHEQHTHYLNKLVPSESRGSATPVPALKVSKIIELFEFKPSANSNVATHLVVLMTDLADQARL